MRPQPRVHMPSTTCLVTLNAELRFVLMTSIQSPGDILCSMLSRTMPALLTRISTGPMSDSMRFTMSPTDSKSATSPSAAYTLSKPSARTFSSQESLCSYSGRQFATTALPLALANRRQIAVPMPPMPPVTSATRFVIVQSPNFVMPGRAAPPSGRPAPRVASIRIIVRPRAPHPCRHRCTARPGLSWRCAFPSRATRSPGSGSPKRRSGDRAQSLRR
jgi:hypothetical protein